MASAKRVSREEYEHLCRIIHQWNEHRLELFEITTPNENLEFEGIMRFYFQSPDRESQKVATKCIRVSNTATTSSVIEALVQKFRPDLRMLTNPSSYALYEVHSNEERKLEKGELPLLVQLGWVRGEKEGRFLLRREEHADSGFKGLFRKSQPHKKDKRTQKRKKLTKKEKERDKVRPIEPPITASPVVMEGVDGNETKGSIARSLYTDMPESRFTRSISIKNSRKAGQVDKRRLSYHAGEELANDGTVRVFADFVGGPDIPCKSLLISGRDTAAQVVKSALDKYGLREDPSEFCLVQVTVPPSMYVGSVPFLNVDYTDRLLGEKEYPLLIHNEWASRNPNTNMSVQFQLRRRASFNQQQQQQQQQQQSEDQSRSHSPEDEEATLPALVEIFQGAQSPPQSPRRFLLSPEATEIGSNVALLDPKSYICLPSLGIKPRHCVIASTQGFFTISPLDKTAVIYVNTKSVKEPCLLPHNAEVKLGDREMFRFFVPVEMKQSSTSMHTLPTNIGRPSSSASGSHSRKMLPHNKPSSSTSGSARPDHISKAYSVEDIFNPSVTAPHHHRHQRHHQDGGAMGGRLKDRAHSERDLKGGGGGWRKNSEPCFIPEEGESSTKGGGGDVFATFPMKKRHHYSSPGPAPPPPVVVGGGARDQEGAESEPLILPASVTFYQPQEALLLQNMISEVNGYLIQFKLAPAYGLYMVIKHHLCPDFQPSCSPGSSERRKTLMLTLKKIIAQIKRAVKESRNIAGALAFWLANTSELLTFLKRDPQLVPFTADFEGSLTSIVHTAYKNFTQCMLKELSLFLPAFHDDSGEADSEEGYISGGEAATIANTGGAGAGGAGGGGGVGKEPDIVAGSRPPISRQSSITGMYWSVAGSKIRRRGRPTIGDILATLNSTIALLNRCFVNKTLSIMIFSLLFRYISTKLFNKVVMEPKYCSQSVGQKLRRRLDRVREWAEKEGMELPAEKHLSMIVQAGNLLQSVKKLPEDAQNIYAVCPRLNSRQVAALLQHCSITEGETAITEGFADAIITLAQTHSDEALRNEGMEIGLEEDPNLELAFLIPQIGYYCDGFRGVPQGLQEYFDPMISAGLCKFTVSKDSSGGGLWAVPARATSFSQSLDGSFSPTALGGSATNMNAALPRALHHSYRAIPEIEPQLQSRAAAVVTTGRGYEYSPKLVQITLTKENNSLGLSIIGGKNHGEDIGIFVKSMVEGGAAFQDGNLQMGDQILQVDDFSLEGCTQEEAAQILRATGKIIRLTVAKQAAQLYGLTMLIQQPSPRHTRKNDQQISEGSSHVRKAKRRQQREKQRQERYQHHEFRLERRKPSDHKPPPPPQSPLLEPPPSSSSGLPITQPPFADPRIQNSNSNPQFAKWIREQNSLYHRSERPGPVGSETDLQSSVSSLANIPERERPNSPGLSYSTSSTKHRRDPSSRNAYYRPQTPPVRDTSVPSRATDFDSYSNYDTVGSSVALDSASEAPSKFSEYAPEPEPSLLPPTSQIPPIIANPLLHGRATNFSSVSSQMTFNSQLTPYSQQQNPSQQMHLDKLSMDVLYHTQLSGNSMQGITSVISKLKPSTKSTKPSTHLDSRDLKEFELDDIELEKQRIQLMFYEQQRQKELESAGSEGVLVSSNGTELARTGKEEEFTSYTNNGGADEDGNVDVVVLKQELESLESMIFEHKKKYRELKFARDREEQSLKQIEMRVRDKELLTGKLGLNTTDQHGWPVEQNKLHDLERMKAEHSKRLQNMVHNEHRTKTKLKALEAQAVEIRQNIHTILNTPTQLHGRQVVKSSASNYSEVAHNDTLPSKLVSDLPPQRARKNSRSTETTAAAAAAAGEWDLSAFNGRGSKPLGQYPNRIMSMESMTTATYDQPEIARELAVTISESNLTEPTRDDSNREPVNALYNSGSKTNMMASGDLRTSHSSVTHITESDDVFIQEEFRRRQREEHTLATADLELKRSKDRDLHMMVQLQQQEAQQQQQDRHYKDQQRWQQRLSSSGGGGGVGGWEPGKFPSHEDVSMINHPVSHDSGWKQTNPPPPPPHSKPQPSGGWNDQQPPPQQQHYPQGGHIYDVPSPSRSTHQHRSTGHHYSKHNRSRAHHHHHQPRNQTTTSTMDSAPPPPPPPHISHVPEHPVQDNPRTILVQAAPPVPDVIPVSFASAGPTTGRNVVQQSSSGVILPLPHQRQVTGGGERTTSPLNRGFSEYAQPQSPSYMSSYAHYAVPPSRPDQERSHSSFSSSRPQQQSPIPVKPETDATSKSPTNDSRQKPLQTIIYDQPKLASPRHPVQSRSPISRTSPHDFSSSRGGANSSVNIYDTVRAPQDHMHVPPTSMHHVTPHASSPHYSIPPHNAPPSEKIRTAQMPPDRSIFHHTHNALPSPSGQHNQMPPATTAVHHTVAAAAASYNPPPPERYTAVTLHNASNIHSAGPHERSNIHTSGTPHNPPPAMERGEVHGMTKPPSSTASVHRYAPSREGGVKQPAMGGGHSYMRGRPEQAMTFEDRMKLAFVDRSHRNQAGRHPERIQRQQTEL